MKVKLGDLVTTRTGGQGIVEEIDGDVLILKRPGGGKTITCISNVVEVESGGAK